MTKLAPLVLALLLLPLPGRAAALTPAPCLSDETPTCIHVDEKPEPLYVESGFNVCDLVGRDPTVWRSGYIDCERNGGYIPRGEKISVVARERIPRPYSPGEVAENLKLRCGSYTYWMRESVKVLPASKFTLYAATGAPTLLYSAPSESARTKSSLSPGELVFGSETQGEFCRVRTEPRHYSQMECASVPKDNHHVIVGISPGGLFCKAKEDSKSEPTVDFWVKCASISKDPSRVAAAKALQQVRILNDFAMGGAYLAGTDFSATVRMAKALEAKPKFPFLSELKKLRTDAELAAKRDSEFQAQKETEQKRAEAARRAKRAKELQKMTPQERAVAEQEDAEGDQSCSDRGPPPLIEFLTGNP